MMKSIWDFIRAPFNAIHIALFVVTLVSAVLGMCDYWFLLWPPIQWLALGYVYVNVFRGVH